MRFARVNSIVQDFCVLKENSRFSHNMPNGGIGASPGQENGLRAGRRRPWGSALPDGGCGGLPHQCAVALLSSALLACVLHDETQTNLMARKASLVSRRDQSPGRLGWVAGGRSGACCSGIVGPGLEGRVGRRKWDGMGEASASDRQKSCASEDERGGCWEALGLLVACQGGLGRVGGAPVSAGDAIAVRKSVIWAGMGVDH